MWSNLRKSGRMDTGTVGFVKEDQVRHIMITRDKPLARRMMKAKVTEEKPDLIGMHTTHMKQTYAERRVRQKEQARREKQERLANKAEKERRDYKHMFKEEDMTTNQGGDLEDAFGAKVTANDDSDSDSDDESGDMDAFC
ncbi:hypothetical protein KIPB_004673 [Kipferlia bialata]|uniref:NFACT RNA-binding domain-containing protein n=1 Tax=Kipferlia bialata TaxID=797122 RepID=A0A9K3GIF8_9EUKA|nr:hypothetical protein KIPB_004673 [Kipferlia bialata]|eukprot:g4673.t1